MSDDARTYRMDYVADMFVDAFRGYARMAGLRELLCS